MQDKKKCRSGLMIIFLRFPLHIFLGHLPEFSGKTALICRHVMYSQNIGKYCFKKSQRNLTMDIFFTEVIENFVCKLFLICEDADIWKKTETETRL
jgi:hypothetical protein